LNGDAPLEVIYGSGSVLSFIFEEIEGFVIGPITGSKRLILP
jgi:hypothetical protein